MRTKSAYRTKLADNTPAETPNIPERVQPSETTHIEFTDKPEPVAAIEPATDTDEATATLLQQLQHLRASEQAQREFATQVAAQRAAQMAAPEPTLPADPKARIALWRTQGLTDEDAAFLSEHLEMAAEPRLTRLASDEAAEHRQRGTDDHRRLTKEIFDQHLALQQPAPAAPVQPAPAFFAPPSPVSERPGPASYVSAPVSRHAAGSPRKLSRSVRLSPAEIEMAKASGVSETEYGRQKLIMMARKANGEIPQ